MIREELQALSIAELIDLCLKLQAQVKHLQARVTELEQRLGPPKTARNSSVPPAKSDKPNPPLQKLHSRHQQVELPEIRPSVTEVRCYATTCPQCGTAQHSTYPAGLEPSHLFGPQLEALTTYLREQHHHAQARSQGHRRGDGTVPSAGVG